MQKWNLIKGSSLQHSKSSRDYRVCKEAMEDVKKFEQPAEWGRKRSELRGNRNTY